MSLALIVLVVLTFGLLSTGVTMMPMPDEARRWAYILIAALFLVWATNRLGVVHIAWLRF